MSGGADVPRRSGSIAHFLEQLHDLPPPGADFFYVLIDVAELASQRFNHRRARRKVWRGLAERGANLAQRETQSLRGIDQLKNFRRRVRIGPIAIPIPGRLWKHVVLRRSEYARLRSPFFSRAPRSAWIVLDLKLRFKV